MKKFVFLLVPFLAFGQTTKRVVFSNWVKTDTVLSSKAIFVSTSPPKIYPIWLPADGRGATYESAHTVEAGEGIIVLPNPVGNNSHITLLSKLGANGQVQWAAMDTGGVYRFLAFMGHDVGNGSYPSDTYHKDGLPTVFILHAFAEAGAQGVRDHISIVRDTLTYSSGEKIYPGMTAIGATVPFHAWLTVRSPNGNYAGRSFSLPSSKAILDVARGNSDSTNPYLWLSHGPDNISDLEITASATINVATKAGLISPLNGLGWRLNYWDSDSLRNKVNIQAGTFQTQISADGTNIKYFYVNPYQTYTNNHLAVDNTAQVKGLYIGQNGSLIDSAKVVSDTLRFYVGGVEYKAIR